VRDGERHEQDDEVVRPEDRRGEEAEGKGGREGAEVRFVRQTDDSRGDGDGHHDRE
jgi:hypothetical protein